MGKAFSSGWSSALAGGADTIIARATPPGRSGLAVIRVSGSATEALAAVVCPGLGMDRAWRASLVEIVAPDGGTIDRGIATVYRAPRSYTGEDMVEITVHGSPWVAQATIDAFTTAGARPAEAGEFTRRAVANGKLDLVQAEAVNDLASAETEWQARVARAQVEGVLSREFTELRDGLADTLARLEATLDFGHHDIAYDPDAIGRELGGCLMRTRELLATAPAGRRIRDGVRVAIVGPPNSGKSTLFNLLVGRERAIVSPHPGTTRDVVEAELDVTGVRVVLQDTAGLGATADPVEREGMRRARGAAASAGAVVLLWPFDGGGEEPVVDWTQPTLRVRSKWDLAGGEPPPPGWLPVSCSTESGLDELWRSLSRAVVGEVADLGGEIAIAERHRVALERAASELDAAELELPEVAAEAIRSALDAVRELTGEVATEDLLDRIFGSFCIGK